MTTRTVAAFRGKRPTSTGELDADKRILMTIRVSRDSGKTWMQSTAVHEGDVQIEPDPLSFPACRCPRCVHAPTGAGPSL